MDLEYLKGLAGQSPEQNLADARRTVRMFRRLWSYPKPIIAAVNGAAMAGGCGIATLGDFTLASEEAKFGYTEVRVGFMPALISAFLADAGRRESRARPAAQRPRLRRRRGAGAGTGHEGRARGATAYPRPANSPPRSSPIVPARLHATKRLLVHCSQAELIRRLELGVEESVAIRNTADFREGLAAFLEKRKPKWSA